MHGTLMTMNGHVLSILPRIKMKLKYEVIFLYNNWRKHKEQDRLDQRHNFMILMNCLKPCKDHLTSNDNLISSSFPNSPCNFYQIYHIVCPLHFSNSSCSYNLSMELYTEVASTLTVHIQYRVLIKKKTS